MFFYSAEKSYLSSVLAIIPTYSKICTDMMMTMMTPTKARCVRYGRSAGSRLGRRVAVVIIGDNR